MKELNFRSEPSSPLLSRAFPFLPSPLRRRLGEFRSTRGAEPSRAWVSSQATRSHIQKQRGTARAFLWPRAHSWVCRAWRWD